MKSKATALLLCLMLIQIQFSAAAKDSGYTVIYDGGSLPGLKSGAKMKMYIESSGIRLMDDKGKTLLMTVVPSTVTEVSYGQDVHRRVGTAIGLAVVSLGIGALMLLSKSKKHFVFTIIEAFRTL